MCVTRIPRMLSNFSHVSDVIGYINNMKFAHTGGRNTLSSPGGMLSCKGHFTANISHKNKLYCIDIYNTRHICWNTHARFPLPPMLIFTTTSSRLRNSHTTLNWGEGDVV